MHAWLIASMISNVISPCPLLRSPCVLAPILTDTNFHLTHQKLGKTHTHHFMTLWPDQGPAPSLACSLADLDSIACQIEYPIGKSAAWIFLYSDKLCRIYIFPWFTKSQEPIM